SAARRPLPVRPSGSPAGRAARSASAARSRPAPGGAKRKGQRVKGGAGLTADDGGRRSENGGRRTDGRRQTPDARRPALSAVRRPPSAVPSPLPFALCALPSWAAEPAAKQGPEGAHGIPPADLLPRVFRPGVIADRDFLDPLSPQAHFGG